MAFGAPVLVEVAGELTDPREAAQGVEVAEYKHLVLGLIFLKYISDSFTLRREQLQAELADLDSEL
jgi:type I restriction-modification system DNA methylase subunit